MFVSKIHVTVSAPCTFLKFTFVLSTNFLDYIFKLSILLHFYVKYSQLEIMKECCFTVRFPDSLLSVRTFTTYDPCHREINFSGIQLKTAGCNPASYIIRDSISKAPILCGINDSGCELVLPYEFCMNRNGNHFYVCIRSGYDSVQWPQAPHLQICCVNVASRIYCELNYRTVWL
jgi:hypothetical protein